MAPIGMRGKSMHTEADGGYLGTRVELELEV